ncbi:EF-hand domain-containing, partial [Paramuricea clavata]
MNVTEPQKAYHLSKMRTRVYRRDKDNDGFISCEDFQSIATNLVETGKGITKEKTEEIFSACSEMADLHGLKPGVKLTLEEAAVTLSDRFLSPAIGEKLSGHPGKVFDCFDTNGNGRISIEEFRVDFKVLGLNATDEEIKHSFDTIDSDSKDEISRE